MSLNVGMGAGVRSASSSSEDADEIRCTVVPFIPSTNHLCVYPQGGHAFIMRTGGDMDDVCTYSHKDVGIVVITGKFQKDRFINCLRQTSESDPPSHSVNRVSIATITFPICVLRLLDCMGCVPNTQTTSGRFTAVSKHNHCQRQCRP